MKSSFWITRWCLQRGLAFIYSLGFLIALNQGPGLIGPKGILPAERITPFMHFWHTPSLYLWNASGTALFIGNTLGLLLSLFALSGLSERFKGYVSALTWFLLWALYLSLVNIGQIFYGYGWEIMLCEAGFLAIFLGSRDTAPPVVVIWMYRWLLFRLMFGAGMIKLRGDECWWDLTCMNYHFETQPLPNPLSRLFHFYPVWFHKMEVAINHFIEILVPFGFFVPGIIARVAGVLTILFQISIIISGNLSWLNYIAIVVAFSCLDDAILGRVISSFREKNIMPVPAVTKIRSVMLTILTVIVGFLSISPAINLLSPEQQMNTNYDPFNIVNTYGAFGSVTKTRYEIILEGTHDEIIAPTTRWSAYEFRCKPGDEFRAPCFVSPYHYKLDWQMWFAAMSGIEDHPWMVPFIYRLLEGEPSVTALLKVNPFKEQPPQFIRARLMEYHFSPLGSKAWWKASSISEYLRPVSLKDFKL